jgi:urease accessory protein
VAVRLVPLGQSQGLEVLRGLMATIADTALHASRSGLAELGAFAPAADIASMRHETLQPRIFRT